MRKSTTLNVVAIISTACGGGPGIRNPSRPAQVDTSVVAASRVDTSDVFMRDAIRVANQAAGAVDTIIVRPDSITLKVGQSVEPSEVLTVEARDKQGRRVERFAPLLRTEDRSIAEYGGAGLTGHRVGRTRLVIAAVSLGPSASVRDVQTSIVVVVIP